MRAWEQREAGRRPESGERPGKGLGAEGDQAKAWERREAGQREAG